MNASVSAQPGTPLLFRWEAPRRRRLAIVGFLGASTFAHAICFYLFQIVYPPTVSLLPPPARVSLITPSSEEGRTLLRWIEAEDPALASTTVRSRPPKTSALPAVEHIPSYSGYEPALKHAPPLVVDLSVPSAQPPGAVPITYSRPRREMGVVPTAVSFSKEVQEMGAANLPAMKFTASRNELPESIRFRVAIDGYGEVRYCFPLNSSGDALLDGQAREFVVLARFQKRSSVTAADALVWGISTVEWGNDIERAAERSTTSARP